MFKSRSRYSEGRVDGVCEHATGFTVVATEGSQLPFLIECETFCVPYQAWCREVMYTRRSHDLC